MAKPEKDEAIGASGNDDKDKDASTSGDEGVDSAESTPSADEVLEPDEIDAELAAEADAAVADIEDAELAAEADAAVAGVEESQAVAKAQAEAAEWQDKFMRLHAEWDTYRRRTKEQREEEKARATEQLVTSLLPVIDDFERTITYATDNGEEGLLSGVEAVYAKLVDTLKKDGVEIIDPTGEAFDALEAQAVATVDDDSVPDETVAQVYQKGYRLGTKVLRPATVTVTTGGPKREVE